MLSGQCGQTGYLHSKRFIVKNPLTKAQHHQRKEDAIASAKP